jgi:hypothetical protein
LCSNGGWASCVGWMVSPTPERGRSRIRGRGEARGSRRGRIRWRARRR